MIGELHDPGFSFRIDACDAELSLIDFVSEYRIEAIVAEELLHDFLLPVSPMGNGVLRYPYFLSFTDKGASQLADKKCRCPGRRFFVLCILNSQHVARILYQSMLKAPSGSNKRPSHLTSEPDPLERSVHAFVRAAWRTP